MPVDVILVLCLSAGIVSFALWRGGKPERLGAAILVLGWCVDVLVLSWTGQAGFIHFSENRFLIDLTELALLVTLALKANRVWPIFSAAAQLVAVGGSLAVLGIGDGMRVAYWAVTQLPWFGQLLALALGTLHHMRRQAAIGPYRDWRPAHSPQH